MTDDAPGTVLSDDELNALLARPLTELSVDELMAMKATGVPRGFLIHSRIPWEVVGPLLAAGAIYSKAFLETVAKHHADTLMDAVRTHVRKNGKTREVLVGPEDGSAAVLIVNGETPDEARLAVLDLDVTSDELRGKYLRWDNDAMAWRPDDSEA